MGMKIELIKYNNDDQDLEQDIDVDCNDSGDADRDVTR